MRFGGMVFAVWLGIAGPAFAQSPQAIENARRVLRENADRLEKNLERSRQHTEELQRVTSSPIPSVGVSAGDGSRLRLATSIGFMGAGAVLLATGVGLLANRQDARAIYQNGTIIVTKKDPATMPAIMVSLGAISAAAGAFLLWIEPRLNLGWFDGVPSVAPTRGGAVAAWQWRL